MKFNTYLNFDGNCLEAFEFYKSVFGGEFVDGGAMKMSDLPDMPVQENEKDRVMYMALQFGDNMLMGSDILPSMGHKHILGTTNYISISPDSREEADRIFAALSVGGDIEMPIGEQFFGYFGSFRDKFGIQWMLHMSLENENV